FGDKIRFHPMQSGFTCDRATGNNIVLLQALMKARRAHMQPMHIALLDISKAFDTVSHYGMLQAMKERRFPTAYISVIENAYTDCCTSLTLQGARSRKLIAVKRGIK